jgi:hypothetical protein
MNDPVRTFKRRLTPPNDPGASARDYHADDHSADPALSPTLRRRLRRGEALARAGEPINRVGLPTGEVRP